MNNILVSVIVPIYNVEEYLKKCLDSIINQTYKKIEIILVDDGSTDYSGNICDEYSKIDRRIKVIHKENGGLSSARNVGIDNSSGKYIVFIDSDDWINSYFIENLYTIAYESNSDLVISGLKRVFNMNNFDDSKNDNSYRIISKTEALNMTLLGDNGIDVSACGKMYKSDIFRNIKYPIGELYEDFLIIDNIIEKCNKIAITNYRGYYYYQRFGSIMHSKYSKKRYVLIEKSEQIIKKSQVFHPEIIDYAIYRYIINNLLFIKMTVNDLDYKAEYANFCQNLKKYSKEFFKFKFVSIKTKLLVFIILRFNCVFRLLWKLKRS